MKSLREIRTWNKIITLILATIIANAGMAAAATISGTITNNTEKTGRIFVSVQSLGGRNTGLGVSIDPTTTTNYTIRGVQQGGTYQIKAFMCTHNTVIQHANDPVGYSSSLTLTNSTYSGANISLSDPTPVSLQPPPSASIVTGDKLALVTWQAPADSHGYPIATSYKVYWSVTPNPGPSNMAGGGSSPEIYPTDKNGHFITFSSNGLQFYFAVTSLLNNAESTPTNVNGGSLITIGPPSGGVVISGTVSIPGISLSSATPLGVMLNTVKGPSNITAIAAPSNDQPYTIAGVQPGDYQAAAILLMNSTSNINRSVIDNIGETGVPISVHNVDIANVDISLSERNAATYVATNHWQNGIYEGYGLQFKAKSQIKRLVNVAISGPQLGDIFDLTPTDRGDFEYSHNIATRPTILPPDTYQFATTYADGTTSGTTPYNIPITGIVDSFATPVSPVGTVPLQSPSTNFSWSTPLEPPSPFFYSLGDYFDWLSSNTTSVNISYPFSDGTSYNWQIEVNDRYGNKAQKLTSFTPTSNTIINGFTPTVGVPGTKVTITGANFDGTAPANNLVIFSGTWVMAEVLSATATQLVVTVPTGAAAYTGKISITVNGKSTESNSFFTILPTISLSGIIRSSIGPEGGVSVELPGNVLVKTVSATNGTYHLAGLPSGQPFFVKLSKAPFFDVYSKYFNAASNLSGMDFRLFSAADVAAWGVTTGNGVIRGRILNKADATVITGATVTITSPNPAGYSIVYADSYFEPDLSLTSTTPAGVFYILNITPGDSLTAQASATGFNTSTATFTSHTDAVTEGAISLADTTRPNITSFSMPTAYNNLTVPITSLSATDNAAVTGYMVTESTSTPSIYDSGWSTSLPANFTFSGIGIRTAYAWAKDATGNVSYGIGRTVSIDLLPPTTLASPAGGTITGPVSVYLTTNEPATIYYTSNGIDPTTTSQSFTDSIGGVAKGPIYISANTTLKFFARDLAGNNEPIKTEVYLYGTVRILRQPVTTYSTISSAYNDVKTGETIQAQNIVYNELLTLGRAVSFSLMGGCDSNFNPTSGFTSIGKLTITSGSVTLDKITIK